MGVTTKHISKPVNTLGAGVHLAVITSVKYARDSSGNILTKPETGDPAIEIEFKNGKGLRISATFWMTEKALWVFQRLCDAIDVIHQGKDGVSVRDVVGRRLWIVVGYEFVITNGILQVDGTGKLIMYPKLLPKFIKVIDPSIAPALEGDPMRNNGIPGVKFIYNKAETLPEDFEQQFKESVKTDFEMMAPPPDIPGAYQGAINANVISDTNYSDSPF